MPDLSLTQSLEITVSRSGRDAQPDVEKEKRSFEDSDSTAESRSSVDLGDNGAVRDGTKDLEAGDVDLERKESLVGERSREVDDRNIVWWDGDNDPANPMNWSAVKKWTNISVMSMITFLTPLASSMFAPGVSQLMDEFNNTNELLAGFVVSIYVLGLAFGPLVLAPLSEVYGRLIVYSTCNILFVIFTLACAVSTNISMLIVFRFLAGCSAPLSIGGGTVADLFPVEQRGLALSFYTLGPILGPAVGPVAGGFLSQAKGWRWIFWILTIFSGAITLVQFLLMRETYAATLLARKTKRLQEETGNTHLRSKLDTGIPPREILLRAIVRPTKMILLSPINIILAAASAFIYGIFYLLLTTFPLVFQQTYSFSIGIAGLAYMGLGVGHVLGMLVFICTSDRYIRARAASGKPVRPEDRLPLLLLSGPLIAGGLFWYGWAAQAKTTHWIVPILGSALVGVGNMCFFMPVMAYLVDAFTMYAASALAANTVLRSVGGALLPLAGRSMYATLRFGWGNSLLGFLALGFCPALLLLYRFGERIRVRYPVQL